MSGTPNRIEPPRWATRLLHWYCKATLAEDLEGDLREYFDRNLKNKGRWQARTIYVIDVIKFIRPYTIRQLRFVNFLIHWLMLNSYIKTSGRNMVRNKLFTAINVFGLAIAMSVGLTMIAVLSDIASYDRFHENRSRIYRVTSGYEFRQHRDPNNMATTSMKAGQLIHDNFSMAEKVAIFNGDFNGDLSFSDKVLPISGYWANQDALDAFSFKMKFGNAATALKEPFSIVLTEKTANKLFGQTEVVGKTVTLNKGDSYTITGVLEDIPKFSHIQFEGLGSLPTLDAPSLADEDRMTWDNIWQTWVYVLLRDGVDPAAFKAELDALSKREDPSVAFTHIELMLQPMSTIMAGEDLNNQIGRVMGKSDLYIYGGLALIVLLSAIINYTNLSIARAMRRTKEVGIRKVVGALKSNVRSQFVVEAVVISLVSLLLAILIFMLLRPGFLSMETKLQDVLDLHLTPVIVSWFFGFALLVGVVAGFFPATFYAKINALAVLKDSSSRSSRGMIMRKVLIVVQYSISIILITATVIGFKQYKHYLAFDLGYNTENIINISLQGNKAALLEKELKEIPEVAAISRSLLVTSIGSYWTQTVKPADNPQDSVNVAYNGIDENYLTNLGHHVIAGRDFVAKPDSAAENEAIVNVALIKRLHLGGGQPEKAIGETITLKEKTLQIVGVVKDFSYGRADDRETNREVMFRYMPSRANMLNVKIQSTDLVGSMARLEAAWKKIDPVHPFSATFYDDQLEQSLSGMKAAIKTGGFLAFLAIGIASLGLLGMVIFTTETRVREVSIRKVLGATEGRLLLLLGKSFIALLGIAVAFSLPVTYLFFEQVVFTEIGNAAPISLGDMTWGVLGILAVAIIMIGTQTLRVARSNPATVLKSE